MEGFLFHGLFIIMTNRLGKILFDEDEIILKYDEGYYQRFETKTNPKYEVGTEWIDLNGSRYFLCAEE